MSAGPVLMSFHCRTSSTMAQQRTRTGLLRCPVVRFVECPVVKFVLLSGLLRCPVVRFVLLSDLLRCLVVRFVLSDLSCCQVC